MSDCCTPTGSELTPIEEARDYLLSKVSPVAEIERVACEAALGRVLAEPQSAAVDVPPWDNSAMDGYAINTADLNASGETRLRVAQRIPAGVAGKPVEPGTAARIFTGAPMPEGADAVVIQERCERDGDWVSFTGEVQGGANVRRAGEDLHQGEQVLTSAMRLHAQHLGLLASVGIGEVPVYCRLRVATFTSGDELVMPGAELGPGQIYNSNRYTFAGLLNGQGCEVIDLGMVPDTFEATCDALQRGAAEADLVLASGGVSVGEEDHVKPAVEKLGSLDLWKIAVRPGKPLAFGHIDGTPFMGAPGNPVSLFVTFCLFARPFILRMQGVEATTPLSVMVPAGFDWPRPDKRREFARARLERDAAGDPVLKVFPSRSSGVLSSVAWANGLAVIPEGRTLQAGDPVEFLSFSELLG